MPIKVTGAVELGGFYALSGFGKYAPFEWKKLCWKKGWRYQPTTGQYIKGGLTRENEKEAYELAEAYEKIRFA